MSKAPCKNCEKRKVGCHSDCADYAEFQSESKAVKDKQYEENVKHRMFDYTSYKDTPKSRWHKNQKLKKGKE